MIPFIPARSPIVPVGVPGTVAARAFLLLGEFNYVDSIRIGKIHSAQSPLVPVSVPVIVPVHTELTNLIIIFIPVLGFIYIFRISDSAHLCVRVCVCVCVCVPACSSAAPYLLILLCWILLSG